MKYEIHYQGGEWQDSLIVEAEDLETIRQKAYAEVERRGWDLNNVFSTKIEV